MSFRRALVAILGAVALSLGLSAPASAATANPQASCAGLAGASRAGQSGAQAEVVHFVIAEATTEGFPPGANFSDFASFHQETAEACQA
jgi:hypothetical protein